MKTRNIKTERQLAQGAYRDSQLSIPRFRDLLPRLLGYHRERQCFFQPTPQYIGYFTKCFQDNQNTKSHELDTTQQTFIRNKGSALTIIIPPLQKGRVFRDNQFPSLNSDELIIPAHVVIIFCVRKCLLTTLDENNNTTQYGLGAQRLKRY